MIRVKKPWAGKRQNQRPTEDEAMGNVTEGIKASGMTHKSLLIFNRFRPKVKQAGFKFAKLKLPMPKGYRPTFGESLYAVKLAELGGTLDEYQLTGQSAARRRSIRRTAPVVRKGAGSKRIKKGSKPSRSNKIGSRSSRGSVGGAGKASRRGKPTVQRRASSSPTVRTKARDKTKVRTRHSNGRVLKRRGGK